MIPCDQSNKIDVFFSYAVMSIRVLTSTPHFHFSLSWERVEAGNVKSLLLEVKTHCEANRKQ